MFVWKCLRERAQLPHTLRTTNDWHFLGTVLVLVVFFWLNTRVEEYLYVYNTEVFDEDILIINILPRGVVR